MKDDGGRALNTAMATKAMFCIVVLVFAVGCEVVHNRVSGKAWSQTATREEQQQQLGAAPQGDLSFAPR